MPVLSESVLYFTVKSICMLLEPALAFAIGAFTSPILYLMYILRACSLPVTSAIGACSLPVISESVPSTVFQLNIINCSLSMLSKPVLYLYYQNLFFKIMYLN